MTIHLICSFKKREVQSLKFKPGRRRTAEAERSDGGPVPKQAVLSLGFV